MATDSLASATIQNADAAGERMASSRANDDAFRDVNLTAPTGAGDFLKQSQGIRNAGSSSPDIGRRFDAVEATGRKAAKALDIIDQDYIDAEVGKLPLDKMQKEMDNLTASRTRVLPDILADNSITDYRAKVRIAGKIQAMFDSQISGIQRRKEQLESKAENRGKRKVDELKAKANIINKEFETDKFLLTETMARVQSGEASLQDMLEFAAGMQERAAKAGKAGKDNPYVGVFGSDFSHSEISMFLKMEKNGGKLDISDSAGASKREAWNSRYREWSENGKPIGVEQLEGPATQGGVLPTLTKSANDPGFINPFPEPLSSGLDAVIMKGFQDVAAQLNEG